jgi:heat shock protein HtpX
MYKQIDANRHKSLLLIALFTGVLAAAGYAYGIVTNTGYAGLTFALTVSLGMTAFSWFWGDRLVLWTSGAQLIQTREQNPYLWNLVENLSLTAGLPMPKLYLIDDAAPNAFATGRDPAHASVAVTSGLVQLLENEELEGVLAHELSHVKNYDIRWMLLVAVMVGALTMLSDTLVRGRLFGGGRGNRDRNGANALLILVGIVLLILAPVIGELIKLAISRKREYLADASGALLTRYPEGLAKALEKIRDRAQPLARSSSATAHLWIANPFAGQRLSNLFSTHPPIDDRIQELRKMADNL